MRLLNALLALLIALSVVAAPLPAAFGDAHASGGMAHNELKHGELVAESDLGACEIRPAHAHHQHDGAVTETSVAGHCGDAATAADAVGCCEMALCHPFISVRGVDAERAELAALVSGAWGTDRLVADSLSARIERPPRA